MVLVATASVARLDSAGRPPAGSRAGEDPGLVLFTPEGHEDRVGTFWSGSLLCDDVEKTYEEMKARGVEFVQPPKAEHWGTSAIFKDTEGNSFVLSSK